MRVDTCIYIGLVVFCVLYACFLGFRGKMVESVCMLLLAFVNMLQLMNSLDKGRPA